MGWVLLVKGRAFGATSNYCEFQISDESDIQSPSAEADSASPGSKAYLDDLSATWNKGNDGTWNEVGA